MPKWSTQTTLTASCRLSRLSECWKAVNFPVAGSKRCTPVQAKLTTTLAAAWDRLAGSSVGPDRLRERRRYDPVASGGRMDLIRP